MNKMHPNVFRYPDGFFTALLAGIILLPLMACSNNPGLANMNCTVSTTGKEECQSIPTLSSGTLKLKRNGSFELTGNYMSCFQSSKVRILGQYQHTETPTQIIEMELSAEKIEQNEGKKIDFPRTIGVINLDRTSGKGNFIDIWSNIRMKGLVKQETIPKELNCKPT